MPIQVGTEMPSLEGATEWFNATAAHAEAEAKGHRTLVHFWSISCEACRKNMPHIAEWRDKREREGLRVIAVHVPQSDEEKDPELVREAIALLNITEPCAVDNEYKLRAAFQNQQDDLPAYYLFDAESKLQTYAADERGLETIASTLDRTPDTAAKD